MNRVYGRKKSLNSTMRSPDVSGSYFPLTTKVTANFEPRRTQIRARAIEAKGTIPSWSNAMLLASALTWYDLERLVNRVEY
jgi:hypothetical protein